MFSMGMDADVNQGSVRQLEFRWMSLQRPLGQLQASTRTSPLTLQGRGTVDIT